MSKPELGPPLGSVPVVVLGLDGQRRPRAGTFLSDQAAQATERAKAANYVCAPIDSAAMLKATEGIKPGDLAKEGAEFVPMVIRAAYERLLKATGVIGSSAPTEERREQASKDRLSVLPPPRLPTSWKDIEVGDMVLAEDAIPGDGWYEARILEKVGMDQFKLIFRDYPEEGEYVRRRDQLALPAPTTSLTKPSKQTPK